MAIKKISIPGKMIQTDPITLAAQSITLTVNSKRALCFLAPEDEAGNSRTETWNVEVDLTNPIIENFINYITDLADAKRSEES